MIELIDTVNNGETEVLVVPKGQFYGSDSEGNPIPESIDETVIDTLAEQLKDKELLVDKDHSSVKKGIERDTSAMGWMYSFKKGMEGLWAKIKWTNIGRNLVENRVFRFLSPVFTLHENKPTNMLNVALTNQPAFQDKAKPIINNKPNMEEYEMTMTKEELVSLIKETVAAMNTEQTEVEKKTEETEQVKEEVAENACSEDKAEEPVENECADVVKNEDTKEEVTEEVKEEVEEAKEEGKSPEEIKEEVKEEIVEEKKEESDDSEDEDKKEKKEEVIKLEALNSTPKTEGIDIVKNFAPTQTSAKGYAITTIVR